NSDSLTFTIEATASTPAQRSSGNSDTVRGCVTPSSSTSIGPPPRQLLGVVDLTQIQHVPLHHASPGGPRVLDNAPVAMLLAILPANLAAQEHDGRRLSAHYGLENRLGRHYSRFPPFSPTPALADQSLALRKLCDAGSNRRSRASQIARADEVPQCGQARCAGARKGLPPRSSPIPSRWLLGPANRRFVRESEL